MYKTILVPLDGSAVGRNALPVAAQIALRTGARLHLLLVHDPGQYISFVPGEIAVPMYDADDVLVRRNASERDIEREVSALVSQGLDAKGKVVDGSVVETIIEYAQKVDADLTVMTTHGRTGFVRLQLGSVTTNYVRSANGATLLVRITENDDAPSITPGGQLLCPLDGSDFAELILPHTIALAEALALDIHLLSVTKPGTIPMAPFGTASLLGDARDLAFEEESREKYLRGVAERCPAGTSTRVVSDMSAAGATLEIAREPGCSAIAIATHARSGFKRLMLGSVADEVLRGATVPVLMFKPADS